MNKSALPSIAVRLARIVERSCAPYGLVLVGALGLVCSFAFGSSAMASSRPNILFVLTDDVGWGDFRAYNPNSKVALPAIEKLASEGIRFTDAHTSAALCAPSRYSIISGNYEWRGRHGWGQWNYKGGSQVLSGQDTLGDMLRRAGYVTAVVGKYHLGAQFYKKNSTQFASDTDLDTSVDFARAMTDGPAQHGFDYSFLAMRGIQDGPYAFFENGGLYGNPTDLVDWIPGDYGDTEILTAGIGVPNWVTRDVGPTLLSKAVSFIDTHMQAQASTAVPKPFFLFLNTEGVHSPLKPPYSIGDRKIRGTSRISARCDMLVEIDAMVEGLLRTLEQHGVLQDTLIIVSSDNGAYRVVAEEDKGHLANGSFRGAKGSIYEGGHRVPLIIKWGQGAFGTSSHLPGTAINVLVGVQDLYATLAELVGVPLAVDQGRDSVSFLPLLMGQSTAIRGQIVQQASLTSGIPGKHFAYRSGSWKLVFNSARSPVGLYDLAVDPYEKTDLIAQTQQAERVAAMTLALENALASQRTAPFIGTDPESVNVPIVVGLTQAAATAVLTDAGLVLGTVTQQSSATVPAGDVISQNPAPGTSVAAGSQVNLVVSNGPAVTVPDVVGLTQAAATTALTIAGLVLGTVTQQSSTTVPAGSVIGQNPVAGTSVAAGSLMNLVVSSGSISASASVAPTSLPFGSRELNTSSVGKTVTITNIGTVLLPISSITLTGTNPEQFSRSANCPSQVPVGGTCTAAVVFKPTSTGTKSANLTMAFGSGATNRTVALSGTGVHFTYSVSPTSLAFGNVARGGTSTAKTVTVTNTGTVTLAIISITLAGTSSGQFAQTNNCPAQVTVGGKCTVSVNFRPTSAGTKSATIKVQPGGGASATTVVLSGTGT